MRGFKVVLGRSSSESAFAIHGHGTQSIAAAGRETFGHLSQVTEWLRRPKDKMTGFVADWSAAWPLSRLARSLVKYTFAPPVLGLVGILCFIAGHFKRSNAKSSSLELGEADQSAQGLW